ERDFREREGLGEMTGPRLQRFVLTGAEAGIETVTVSFLDGSHENIDSRYAAELAANFAAANLPEVFWPRATAIFQRTIGDLLERRPFDTFIAAGPTTPETTEPTREQRAAMLQQQLHKLGRWWAVNGDTPVSHFNR